MNACISGAGAAHLLGEGAIHSMVVSWRALAALLFFAGTSHQPAASSRLASAPHESLLRWGQLPFFE